MKKIIDVSGFGHSGKSAISEFLAGHEDFFSFPVSVEFELFRVNGGILDLYFSIFYSWNLIRSKYQINQFRRLILRIGTVANFRKPLTYLQSSSHSYNKFFNNRFIEISQQYLNDLIVLQDNTFWPYDRLYLSKFDLLLNKLKQKIFKNIPIKKVYYTNRNNFIPLTSKYIHDLFNEVNDKSSNIVLNNAFDPYNPSVCTEIIQNSYSIIVERDPRDIYASLINSSIGFIPDFENYKLNIDQKKKMVSMENIDKFILRYKTLMENINHKKNKRLLRIQFEDFVQNHEESKIRIFKFLEIPLDIKRNQIKFNSEDSKKNIGLWKHYSKMPEIIQIQKELTQYCYQD
jgi:hypothetical protein